VSDLRVDSQRLRELSARLTIAASSIRFNGGLTAPPADVLGSSEVASALRDGTVQQSVRSGAVADTLHAVGASPAQAAASFVEADAALARVF
jgi:hypothetical protein